MPAIALHPEAPIHDGAADLPPPTPEVAYLVEAIGALASFRLVEARGGTRLYIPSTVRAGNHLVPLIGREAAMKAARAWGGDVLKVPLARTWRARALRQRGRSYREIAIALCMNESTVHRAVMGGARR